MSKWRKDGWREWGRERGRGEGGEGGKGRGEGVVRRGSELGSAEGGCMEGGRLVVVGKRIEMIRQIWGRY